MNIKFGAPIDSMCPDYSEVDLNAKVIDAESVRGLEQIITDAGGVIACEIKEDGYRCQPHVNRKKVQLFTRQLTEFETKCLPEIVDALHALKLQNTILDAEIIGKCGRYNGFKSIQKRARYTGVSEQCIGKYFKEGKVNEFPLELIVFDVMMHKGKSCIELPYTARREIVEQIARHQRISPTLAFLFSKPTEVIDLYRNKVLNGMCEGLVLKQPNLPYMPGDKKHWIKLKKFEPVDLVVVGLMRSTRSDVKAKYGQAMVATYREDADLYQTVGVVNLLRQNDLTGRLFAEDVQDGISEMLDIKPINVEYGKNLPDVYVAPEKSVVLEIGAMNFDHGNKDFACRLNGEKSYSLRSAHVRIIRDDKAPNQATTTEKIAQLHKMQK
ncbi:MAG: hypothetical protein HY363_02190 [Candidatus Aenigmarchaeota archaeon]|nr:hypothetical protein [Candidatus Aenigmarchaeota archaeon]